MLSTELAFLCICDVCILSCTHMGCLVCDTILCPVRTHLWMLCLLHWNWCWFQINNSSNKVVICIHIAVFTCRYWNEGREQQWGKCTHTFVTCLKKLNFTTEISLDFVSTLWVISIALDKSNACIQYSKSLAWARRNYVTMHVWILLYGKMLTLE